MEFTPYFISKGPDFIRIASKMDYLEGDVASKILTKAGKQAMGEREFRNALPEFNEIWFKMLDLLGYAGNEADSIPEVEIVVQTYLLITAEVCDIDLDLILEDKKDGQNPEKSPV